MLILCSLLCITIYAYPPCRDDVYIRPGALPVGVPRSEDAEQAGFPAVGAGPTTVGVPLRVECPRGVGATAVVGRTADGGSPTRLAGYGRMPADGGAAATAGAPREMGCPLRRRLVLVGCLPPAGRPRGWRSHSRPCAPAIASPPPAAARPERGKAAGVVHASGVGCPRTEGGPPARQGCCWA